MSKISVSIILAGARSGDVFWRAARTLESLLMARCKIFIGSRGMNGVGWNGMDHWQGTRNQGRNQEWAPGTELYNGS